MWGLQNEFIYVGANVPNKGDYIGQLIQVDNAAVPSGRSILRWTGALWAPPAGELIASEGLYTTPLASVALASTNNTAIYDGVVIPDYMVPDGATFSLFANATLGDTVTTTGTSVVSATFGSSVPDSSDMYNKAWAFNLGSGAGANPHYGLTFHPNRDFKRVSTGIYGQTAFQAGTSGNACDTARTPPGTFVPGAFRLRWSAKGTATQTAKVWQYRIVSTGGL